MSARRFSVTLSEDDLRPHMRKPKPKPVTSEIQKLQEKADKREEIKREVKKRVEEEERERAQRKRDEEIRRETRELLAIRDVVSRDNNNRNSEPKLGRRFNNFQYFRWDSDEAIPVIPEESIPRPTVTSPLPSTSFTCELCTLALRSVDKTGMPTKSAACAHVDAFVAGFR